MLEGHVPPPLAPAPGDFAQIRETNEKGLGSAPTVAEPVSGRCPGHGYSCYLFRIGQASPCPARLPSRRSRRCWAMGEELTVPDHIAEIFCRLRGEVRSGSRKRHQPDRHPLHLVQWGEQVCEQRAWPGPSPKCGEARFIDIDNHNRTLSGGSRLCVLIRSSFEA